MRKRGIHIDRERREEGEREEGGCMKKSTFKR
jgi:hypothetical protein